MILWTIARASGLLAVAALTLVTVWGALVAGRTFRPAAPHVRLHRLASTLALLLVATHVAALLGDHYANISPPDLVGIDTRPGILLGAAALWLLIALPFSFRLLRARRISQRAWRRFHWTGYALWGLAMVHGIVQGTDSGSPLVVALYSGLGGLVAAAATWRAGVEPAAARRAARVPAPAVAPRTPVHGRGVVGGG